MRCVCAAPRVDVLSDSKKVAVTLPAQHMHEQAL